jgi:hypothetical protein
VTGDRDGRQRQPDSGRQGQLFPADQGPAAVALQPLVLPLETQQLTQWQAQLGAFQAPLFGGAAEAPLQGDLFSSAVRSPAEQLNPLALRAQPLTFWRWPSPPQHGAALYFVLDTGASEAGPLLLYVGETGRADQRWKGEHDCKHYLASYSEALARAGLECRLSIRFWLDAPASLRARRSLEQALIQRWLPPFNKETRQRWATPFTAETD